MDYNQQAQKEIEYAINTCETLKVPYEIIHMQNIMPSHSLEQHNTNQNSLEYIVPNRNSLFLSIATSYALNHNKTTIYIGVMLENTSYKDTTPEFIEAYNKLNMETDLRYIKIKAPLIYETREKLIEYAIHKNIPLHKTWSCYNNTQQPCGQCESCKTTQKITQKLITKHQHYTKKLQQYQKQHRGQTK